MNEVISAFISYSHDSDAHCAWVLKLATDLRRHKIDAILDSLHLRLGDDLGFFMEHGLCKSKYVLCICSENYTQKANSGIGGAGYEKMIMTQELLKNANANYIIPIIRNNSSSQKTPNCLGSKTYLDFCDDNMYLDRYKELLARLYDQDISKIPPLGESPFSKNISDRIAIKIEIEKNKYYAPNSYGTVHFKYDNNNGTFTIGTGEYSFDTRWSRSGNDSIHAYGFIGTNNAINHFPSVDELELFDFSSASRTIRNGQFVVWKNSYNNFAAVKILSVKSSSHGFPHDEMEFEYKICGID